MNDWVRVNHNGDLTFDLDTDPHTIAMFFRVEGVSTTSDPTLIQDRYGSNHSVSYYIGFNGDINPQNLNADSWYGEPTGTNFSVQTPAAGLVGGWHHVAVTFDDVSGIKRLYIDGVEVDSEPRPNEPFNPGPGNALTIGAYWGSCGCITNYFDGQLDDLRIYDRALSPGEVQRLLTCGEPAAVTGASVFPGEIALMTVSGVGEGLAYAWRKDGVALVEGERIRGCTTDRLTISPVMEGDAGSYDVIVTNACGETVSAAAALNVLCPGDYNRDGVVNSGDYFAFLSAFFSACP